MGIILALILSPIRIKDDCSVKKRTNFAKVKFNNLCIFLDVMTKTILIVDDQLCEELPKHLESIGYETKHYKSGREVLSDLNAESLYYDIAVVDLSLDISGHHLISDLKSKYPNKPVALFTAYAYAPAWKADKVIIKPITLDEMVKKIEEMEKLSESKS